MSEAGRSNSSLSSNYSIKKKAIIMKLKYEFNNVQKNKSVKNEKYENFQENT